MAKDLNKALEAVEMTYGQIKQIAEVIYPDSWIYNSWTMNRQYDENYVVTVYFKQGSEAAGNYDGAASYIFLAGEVPEFVVRDTEYTE